MSAKFGFFFLCSPSLRWVQFNKETLAIQRFVSYHHQQITGYASLDLILSIAQEI